MNDRLRLLVLSHVLPYPRSSGQEQRVFYTLQSIRKSFDVTFVSAVRQSDFVNVKEQMSELCDEIVLLPSQYQSNRIKQSLHKVTGIAYSIATGLKFSNYVIGQVEFTPERLASLLECNHYDCVLLEYWHAAESMRVFRERSIPCVLDMHNILWQSYLQQNGKANLSKIVQNRNFKKYKAKEEDSWNRFDGIVAINFEEFNYVTENVSPNTKVFYVPMGTDLSLWNYSWQPSRKPMRVAYYGGLGSEHNQQSALQCAQSIMPIIWKQFPETELWLVGSNPPDSIRLLTADPRIKVTGYVEEAQKILNTMTVVICPWKGTYGFRSRLVEVMALGVPLVTTPDAVHGMGLENGKGLLIGEDEKELATYTLSLISNEKFASEQSRMARGQIENLYSLENTYEKFTFELRHWIQQRKVKAI
jgi:glycosyltransferase involved in cell wall biosynthesis